MISEEKFNESNLGSLRLNCSLRALQVDGFKGEGDWKLLLRAEVIMIFLKYIHLQYISWRVKGLGAIKIVPGQNTKRKAFVFRPLCEQFSSGELQVETSTMWSDVDACFTP